MKRRGFFARIAGAVLALVYCPTKLPGRQAPAIYTSRIWHASEYPSPIKVTDIPYKHIQLQELQQAFNEELENCKKNSDLSPLEEGGGP